MPLPVFVLVFVLVFLVLVGLPVLIAYWIGAAIKRQGQKPVKRFFAPVPRPGTCSFIANEGKIVDIFENVVGWRIEKIGDRNLFVPGRSEPGLLEEKLGDRWIGLYSTIRIFKDFEWTELQEKEVVVDGNKVVKYEIVQRSKDSTDFFMQFSHPVKTDAIEILGNYKVEVTMLVTVLNLDMERAQFLNKDPAILLAGIIQSTVRSYICNMTFNEVKMLAGTGANQNQDLWNAIKKLNGLEMDVNGVPLYGRETPGVFTELGKFIIRGEIMQIDAVGEAAEAIEAEVLADLRGNAKKKEAERTGEAQVIAATKAAEATIIAAEAEATAMDRRRAARTDWVRETIVTPIKEGGAAVGEVLQAEQVASPTSKIVTWVKGGSAITAITPENNKQA